MLLADNDASLATPRRLREPGTHISMDDFGTGYSSLSYPRGFPFDKIKLDHSFVRDLDAEQDSRAIARAIISLGISLGIDVLAAGVETAKQLDLSRREGRGEVLGYIFSPPCQARELPALIARLDGELRAMEYATVPRGVRPGPPVSRQVIGARGGAVIGGAGVRLIRRSTTAGANFPVT